MKTKNASLTALVLLTFFSPILISSISASISSKNSERITSLNSNISGYTTLDDNNDSFAITAGEYCEFLNNVASVDPHNLYKGNQTEGTSVTTPCILRSGTPGYYTYVVATEDEEKLMLDVDPISVMRYCNWLQNGCGSINEDLAITEHGSYTLQNDHLVAINPEATYFIAGEGESTSTFRVADSCDDQHSLTRSVFNATKGVIPQLMMNPSAAEEGAEALEKMLRGNKATLSNGSIESEAITGTTMPNILSTEETLSARADRTNSVNFAQETPRLRGGGPKPNPIKGAKSTEEENEEYDLLPLTLEDFSNAVLNNPKATRMILSEETGHVSIQARDDVSSPSDNNDSENQKIIRMLKDVITAHYSSTIANNISELTPTAFVSAKPLSAAKINEILQRCNQAHTVSISKSPSFTDSNKIKISNLLRSAAKGMANALRLRTKGEKSYQSNVIDPNVKTSTSPFDTTSLLKSDDTDPSEKEEHSIRKSDETASLSDSSDLYTSYRAQHHYQLAAAASALEKATKAKKQGNAILTRLWKKIAKQHQEFAKYYAQIAESHIEETEDLSNFSKTAIAAEASVDQLEAAAFTLEEGLKAEKQGNTILATAWNKTTTLLEELSNYYNQAASAYSENAVNIELWNKAASYAWDCDYHLKSAIKALEKASKAAVQENTILANSWSETAQEHQKAAEYYLLAAKSAVIGDETESIRFIKEATAIKFNADQLESTTFDLEKATEATTQGNTAIAEFWNERAQILLEYRKTTAQSKEVFDDKTVASKTSLFDQTSNLQTQEVANFSLKSDSTELSIPQRAALALEKSKTALIKAEEAASAGRKLEATDKKEVADEWKIVIEDLQQAAEHWSYAHKSYDLGKIESGDLWEDTASILGKEALKRQERITSLIKQNPSNINQDAKDSLIDSKIIDAPKPGQKKKITITKTTFQDPYNRLEEVMDSNGTVISRKEMVADHLLVTLRKGVKSEDFIKLLQKELEYQNVWLGSEIIPDSSLYQLHFEPSESILLEKFSEILETINTNKELRQLIVFAEPDYLFSGSGYSDDNPMYKRQWHLWNECKVSAQYLKLSVKKRDEYFTHNSWERHIRPSIPELESPDWHTFTSGINPPSGLWNLQSWNIQPNNPICIAYLDTGVNDEQYGSCWQDVV